MVIKIFITMGVIFFLLGIIFFIRLGYLSKESQVYKNFPLGVDKGRLKECPQSPNCFRTQIQIQNQDEEQQSSNFNFELSQIETVVQSLGGKVVERKSNYLRVVFVTRLFKFVDDLEVYLKEDEIQIRSASRVGYSDMGVNQRRVQTLINALSNIASDG